MLTVDRVLSFNYPRRELAVTGWSCLENRMPPDELWVEYDGVRVPALTGLPRPDVARSHNTPVTEPSRILVEISGIASKRHGSPSLRATRAWSTSLARFPSSGQDPISPVESEQGDYATWLRTHESRLFWPPSEFEECLQDSVLGACCLGDPPDLQHPSLSSAPLHRISHHPALSPLGAVHIRRRVVRPAESGSTWRNGRRASLAFGCRSAAAQGGISDGVQSVDRGSHRRFHRPPGSRRRAAPLGAA